MRGQEHVYFLIDGSHIDVKRLAATEEFSSFAWFTIDDVLNKIVKWKKAVYQEAFQILGLLQ